MLTRFEANPCGPGSASNLIARWVLLFLKNILFVACDAIQVKKKKKKIAIFFEGKQSFKYFVQGRIFL